MKLNSSGGEFLWLVCVCVRVCLCVYVSLLNWLDRRSKTASKLSVLGREREGEGEGGRAREREGEGERGGGRGRERAVGCITRVDQGISSKAL